MLLNVVTNPVIDPELEPLMLKVSPLLLPTIVLMPAPPPPLIEETAPVAPNVKLSVLVPPTRFWIPVKLLVPLLSINEPLLAPVMLQVLARLLPVKVSLPLPPLMVPLMLPPPLSVKLSLTLPPVRLAMPLKASVLVLVNVPLLAPVMLHALARFAPARESVPALEPTTAVMFWKPPPMLASVPL